MTTDLIYDDIFTKHVMSRGHPERPERLLSAMEYLERAGLIEHPSFSLIEPVAAKLDEIYSLHDEEFIRGVREKSEAGGGFYTLDTSVNKFTYESAIMAAGGGILVVDRILDGKSDNGYVLCRPPGHHAERGRAFGFCFINNIAIAASHLIRKRSLERVLILDYDAHHGNGTQNAFYTDNRVLYIGLHQDGRTLFPGSGFPDEVGSGAGEGYNVNLSMYPGAGDKSYQKVFDEVVQPVVDSYKPQFILVSAGFDCHYTDPLTSLGLTSEGIADLNTSLLSMAEKHAKGNISYFLEGGYDLDAVGRGSQNIVEALLGEEQTVFGDHHIESENCTRHTDALVDRLRKHVIEKYY